MVGKVVDVKAIAEQCFQAIKEGKYTDALIFCKQAAAQGDSNGQVGLGSLYLLGQGVPENNQEAEKWYRLAAMQGDANGQYGLGSLYFDGIGVEQDFQEAARWYRLAAVQGNDHAQAALSLMYFDFSVSNRSKGLDSSDYVRVYMWASLAAGKGNKEGESYRKMAAKMMTPLQISEAQEKAVKCLQSNYKNCD